ncbi:unnamed protein product [Pleuronectes platessa]|uniref:Uncharacterized protein n=1 Tax=Pleuronectes platessa TaxID=8262 RepID=A0A9N7Z4N9_PLEPL|nr:unnamed protein product [Pleuronectes platessa]
MASRLRLHSQLCSIMETMARSALSQISNLVDEDSAELQLEVSRLLFANSALAEKVNRLESELCTVRSDTPNSCKSPRTVGVQTVRHSDGEPQEPGCPTIEAIFGKDWCMSLWKDRDPYHPDTVTDSPQTCDKSVGMISGQITKSDDSVEGAVSSCQQETLSTEAKHEESTAVEPEPLSLGYAADGSTCTLSIDREGEPVESAAAIEKPSDFQQRHKGSLQHLYHSNRRRRRCTVCSRRSAGASAYECCCKWARQQQAADNTN